MGRRREPLDRARRVAMAGLAGRGRRAAAPHRRAAHARRTYARGRSRTGAAGRDGRLEPRTRGARRDLRQRERLSIAARARLDRPGRGACRRGVDRPRADAVLRVQQVRHDARAGRAQEVLLRKGAGRRGVRSGRAAGSSRSPIPGRASSAKPARTPSVPSCTAANPSAAATRPCRTSGWRPARSRAWTSPRCSSVRDAWRTRAARASRRRRTRDCCSERCSVRAAARDATS